jgi:hypothetical protein
MAVLADWVNLSGYRLQPVLPFKQFLHIIAFCERKAVDHLPKFNHNFIEQKVIL